MKNETRIKLRRTFQWVFLAISLFLIFLLIKGTLKSAHQFCPYASVCFGGMSLNPGIGRLIFPIAVIAGLIIAFAAIFFGRKFCGFICPFGTIQGLLYQLNPFKHKNFSVRLPLFLHKILKFVKYIIFLITIIAVYNLFQYGYMKFCPVLAVSHPQTIRIFSVISLFFIFVAGIFIERFWCLYLCPYAAFMNILIRIGKLLHLPRSVISRDPEICISCSLGSKNCPMRIDVCSKSAVDDADCIYCYRCLEKCPKADAVNEKYDSKRSLKMNKE